MGYAQEWETVLCPSAYYSDNYKLSFYSKTSTLLSVANLNKESTELTKQNRFSYETTGMNLQWREQAPFRVSFTLENKQADPFHYKYRVYETTKDAKTKKKWHKQNVYWGLTIELYLNNGQTTSVPIFFCASKGSYRTNYSYKINNESWREYYLIDSQMNISFESNSNKTLSMYINNIPLETIAYSVVGIKSISYHLGSAAYIEVRNLKLMKQTTSVSTSTQKSKQTSTTNNNNNNKQYSEQSIELLNKSFDYADKGEINLAVYYMQESIKKGITIDVIERMFAVTVQTMFDTEMPIYAWENVLYSTVLLEETTTSLTKENLYYIRGLSKILLEDDSYKNDLQLAGKAGYDLIKELDSLSDQKQNQQVKTRSLKKDPNFKIK